MDVQLTEGSSGFPSNVPSVMMARGGGVGGSGGGTPAESSQGKLEPVEGGELHDTDNLGMDVNASFRRSMGMVAMGGHSLQALAPQGGPAGGSSALPHGQGQMDKDFLCPICMEPMRDAFLTACGHSFCYSCITTHLHHKRNCPCCSQFLTLDQIFPNFTLNKLLKKATATQMVSTASPSQHLRLALQHGADVSMSVRELDALLALLAEKRRKAEQEEAEMNMDILLDFLQRSRQKKQAELDELRADLLFIREDIAAVEQRRRSLQQMREQSAAAIHALLFRGGSSSAGGAGGDESGFGSGGLAGLKAGAGGGGGAGGALAGSKRRGGPALPHHLQLPAQKMRVEGDGRGIGGGGGGIVKEEAQVGGVAEGEGAGEGGGLAACGPSDIAMSASTVAKKRRVFSHFDDLQECYLHHRRQAAHAAKPSGSLAQSIPPASAAAAGVGRRGDGSAAEGVREGADFGMGLEDFRRVLSAFTRFSRVKVVAELRQGDLFHSSNIVSSIEFDRDDEFFATAGVSRRIKVFNFSQVVGELADVHCPVVEMPTRSKLSCLSWNPYLKAHIASSDYEGIVTVWDVGTGQSLLEYEEHEKRAWSVDFARTEPTRLVSGSDDGKVKIWCTRQESSILNIDMKANICCVKFNPGSANFIAVGSADHHIHYYDIRSPGLPLHVFSGHRKAVSYVKFLSPSQLASASTDSTLRLWDVHSHAAIRTLRGHTNEKNFVGLSVNSDYIACGSETNEVYIYYKAMSKPMAVHRFTTSDPFTGDDSDEDTAHFISAVCWKGGGGEGGGAAAGGVAGGGQQQEATMLAANSQGTIKVLTLAP
ncbi:hypothetical protein CLOM_g7214 [Closterium sp. NIES-68]|nr:hypothetical protein CLOM_g7214 [Closterium sp. NIES-68]GJP79026.1 hypothetical protein CLOP_g9277 [Closterium sp. NIES-67]